MKDRWLLRGTNFANCNCNQGCPCQFGAPSTHGFCEALGASAIEEGYFNDTRLDGLAFVVLLHWPGEIAEGNGQAQAIVSESATPAQREALGKIIAGESTAPGSTHFHVFASTLSRVHDTIYAPVEVAVDVERRTARIRAGALVECDGKPITDPFSGGEFRAGIGLPRGFEYSYAEVGIASTRARAAIALDLSGTHAHFSPLHMNQDGVIR